MTSEVKFDLIFEISNLDCPGIHVHVASNSHIVDLRGHGSLQTASEVTNGLGIELSGLNNLCSHAFLASNCPYGLNRKDTNIDPLISGSATRTLKDNLFLLTQKFQNVEKFRQA